MAVAIGAATEVVMGVAIIAGEDEEVIIETGNKMKEVLSR